MAIAEEKTSEVIQLLGKYRMVRVASIELDDMMQEVYMFVSSPAFLAMLILSGRCWRRNGRFGGIWEVGRRDICERITRMSLRREARVFLVFRLR